MKKQSDLSRLMGYAGNYRYFTYASWVLSAVSALVALVPFVYIWKILRDVLNAAPDYAQAVNIPHYGWMAVLFAVLSYLIYIAALMCSHLSAFRVATNLRLAVSEHLAVLPLGFTETFGSGKLRNVVSLTGENRILVKEGMARFLLTPIKGLSALLRITGLVNEDTKEILHADYISFGLAPRLNAAGRITHAKYGVELMTTESGEEAEALAQILCDTNIERQHIEREIYEEALQRIAELQIQDDLVLVIDGKDWHPGVIGIVASRILELYHRPVLVITVRNGVGKGSCRSISAFNIHEALEKMAGFLIQYGGHKMAAGFSIPAEKISEFRKRINDYAKEIITVDDRIPVLELEESLPLDEVNIEFIRSLDLLEPYGSDNPKPLFASFRVFVETARRIGNDRKHFKCRLSQNREPVEAIFWGIGDKDPCCPGDIVDIVYEPEIHDWYGKHVQLICKDIRPVKDYFLTRDFLIDVFVRLRELIPNSKSVAVFEIQNRLKRSFEGKYSRQCLCTALSVFEELNILYRFNRNGVDYYQRKVINKKLDLLSSSIYRKYRK